MDGAAAAKARIAAKQRTTLGSGRRLIDALITNPSQAYKSQSRRAGRRSDILKQVWWRAMALGSPADPYCDLTKIEIGIMFTGMFQNEIGVQDEDKWQPVKPLGNGSFGAAGLFKRIDDVGEADDYVVAKHACAAKHDIFDANFPNISREAAIMMQLNEVGNPAILYLRNYRYFQSTEQFLYYLEYCPSLGTEFVRLNYKAMKQFIPEMFLWFMFYGLAKGLVTME